MKKKFDCVQMKREGAKRVLAETAGLTPEEELAYWQNRTREFRLWREEIRAQREGKHPSETPTR